MKTLIMQGVPGSGKSRFVRAYPGNPTVCSADDYFMVDGQYVFDKAKTHEAHHSCLRNFVSAVSSQAPLIIVDNTHIMRWEMSPYAALSSAYGYEIEIHTFLVDAATAFKRNSHNVPWDTILRSAMMVESPLSSWGRHFTHLPDGSVMAHHLSDPRPQDRVL